MVLPQTTGNSWFGGFDRPGRMFEHENDYELYEEDEGFVLSVELPGFDPEEITVSWDEGMLNIAAQYEEARHNRQRTYHRRFRFPKTVEEESIEALYRNGILEIRLPVMQEMAVEGREIEIQT